MPLTYIEFHCTTKIPKSGIPKVNVTFGWPRLSGQKVALKQASAYYPDPTKGSPGSPDCVWTKADGEKCVVEVGPIFMRDETKRRHVIDIILAKWIPSPRLWQNEPRNAYPGLPTATRRAIRSWSTVHTANGPTN